MSDSNCTSFIWAIQNFSYCWQKKDEAVISPEFCIYMPVETKWRLFLYPRSVAPWNEGIFISLYRDKDCKGAEKIRVEFCLKILDTESSCLDDINKEELRKDTQSFYSKYKKDYIESRYLQEDILTIHCKIFRLDGKAMEMRHIFARTIIDIENQNFQCPIDNFSNLAPGKIKSIDLKSESEEAIMQINLDLTNDDMENIRFGIFSYDGCMKFCSVKIFIVNAQKQEVDRGKYEYWFNSEECTMLTTKLAKKELINNRWLYLPEDVLVLRFELTFSKGYAFEGIVKAPYEYNKYPFLSELTENWRKCIEHNISNCPCNLITDLNSLLTKQTSCDMKLKTKTNIFPVHALILKARSPVFEDMFSNNMKEKIEGCADVPDLDDETVRRFLLYLYTDQLEDLTWDDGLKLYKAAEIYKVTSLREKCSEYLKNNLNSKNVCEALTLFDMFKDSESKEFTQNFMLKNAKEIFKSEEWKKFAEANSELALETTLRNWNEE